MTDTLADTMQSWYATQLGHQGSIIELEREYFQAATNETWADAALQFYGEANGSNPVGSLNDEIFKYYSTRSGLTPAGSFSLADHMTVIFGSGGSGHTLSPPITTALEAFFDAGQIDGYQTDNRNTKNLLTMNQASVEVDTTGLIAQGANTNIARVTTQFLHGNACLSLTSVAAGNVSAGMNPATAYRVTVVEGTTYTAVVSSKAATVGRALYIYIDWYNAAGGIITTVGGVGPTTNTSSWSNHSYTAVAPALAVSAKFYAILASTAGAAEVHYIDQLGFWIGSTTDWVPPGKLTPINLLTYNQASVETDTTGLALYNANGTLVRSTTDAAHGAASIQLTSTGSGGLGIRTLTGTSGVPVTAGSVYTFVASVKAPTITTNVTIRVLWYKSDGSASSTPQVDNVPAALSTTYTQRQSILIAPSDAAYASISILWTAVGAGEIVRADQLGIWAGAQLTWAPPYRGAAAIADGSTIDSWLDLSGYGRHASFVVAANKPQFRKTSVNLLTYNQATVETDTTGLTGGTGTPTLARSTAQAAHGVASLSMTAIGAGNMSAGPHIASNPATIVPGATYTATASMRADTTIRGCKVEIWWYTAAQAFISPSSGSAANDSNAAWTDYSVTGVAPANAAYGLVRAFVLSAAVAEVHYVDKLGLVAGSSTTWLPPITLANNKPGVQFDGVNHYIVIPAAIFGAVTGRTTYVVVIPDNVSKTTQTWLSTRITAGPGLYISRYNVAAYAVGGRRISTDSFLTTNYTGRTAVKTVLSATSNFSTGIVTPYVNGVAGSTATMSTTGTAQVADFAYLGAGNGVDHAQGTICAVLVYSGVHTDAERLQIERWLGARYGVTVA